MGESTSRRKSITVGFAEVLERVDALLGEERIPLLDPQPADCFTALEYAAHIGMSKAGALTFIGRLVKEGKLRVVRIKRLDSIGRKVIQPAYQIVEED